MKKKKKKQKKSITKYLVKIRTKQQIQINGGKFSDTSKNLHIKVVNEMKNLVTMSGAIFSNCLCISFLRLLQLHALVPPPRWQ